MSENRPDRRTAFASLIYAMAAVASGCGRTSFAEKRRSDTGRFKVLCTTALVADLLRNIAGEDRAEVRSVMGEGVDPHLYKGSPRDVRDLADADLIFASGLHLEGKLSSLLHHLARQKRVYLLGDELTENATALNRADPWIRDSGVPDPHCWFDVRIWSELAVLVEEFISGYDPENSQVYRQKCSAYQVELQKLDQELKARIAGIPPARRILVTSHDAFRYFGRAYGVQVEGIQGLSTESEAGIRRTNELVNLVVSLRLPAIFVESSVSDDNVSALVEGARARGHELKIGGSLFSDAPGRFGTPEGTYIGMMKHNLKVFSEAMLGMATSGPSSRGL